MEVRVRLSEIDRGGGIPCLVLVFVLVLCYMYDVLGGIGYCWLYVCVCA